MANRNPADLDREQRGSSNPNQTERPEDRSTKPTETGMGDTSKDNLNQDEKLGRDQGVGSETEDRGQGNVGSSREGGTRSTGSIEGDEDLNRR